MVTPVFCSLRRARADAETTDTKKKTMTVKPVMTSDRRSVSLRNSPAPQPKPKPAAAPFARTDVGRFSMRSVASTPKVSTAHRTELLTKPVDKI